MNDTPEVSIIIPTYNRRELLEQAVQSALAQDYDKFEIVIVNNASTDSTQSFLATLRHSRIHVYEQPSWASMQENIWFALHCARGRYAVILSDDDLLAPEFLSHGMSALCSRTDPCFYTVDFGHIDADGHLIGDRPSLLTGVYCEPRLFFRRNWVGLCATLFPVEAVRNIGFVDNMFFDWTWWNVLSLSGFNLAVSSERLAFYRIHPSSTTVRATEWQYAEATRDMYHFLLGRFDQFKELHRLYHDAEARCRYWASREDPTMWRPFVAYGLTHWSFESAKLLLMRCVPLKIVNIVRQVRRRGGMSLPLGLRRVDLLTRPGKTRETPYDSTYAKKSPR